MSRGWDLSSYPAIRYAPKRVNGRGYLYTVIRFQITNGALSKINFIFLNLTYLLYHKFFNFSIYDILNYWFKAHTPRQGALHSTAIAQSVCRLEDFKVVSERKPSAQSIRPNGRFS